MASAEGAIRDLAAVLARGILRLARNERNAASSPPGEPQKAVDVARPESPHVVDNGSARGDEHAC